MRRVSSFILAASLAIGFAVDALAVETHWSLYAPASCREVQRAGYPWCIAARANPNNTCDYCGYYVGGGACTHRNPGCGPQQGTWGWDYTGHIAPRVVALGWLHPPREQGGTGSYEPDGPHCVEELHHE